MIKKFLENMFFPEFPKEMKMIKFDSSEPILLFVRIFQTNPRRFRLKRNLDYRDRGYYILKDKLLNIDYFIYCDNLLLLVGDKTGDFDWITFDERRYLRNSIYPYYEKLYNRIKSIDSFRQNRLYQKGRQRYVDLYCGSNKDV